METVAVQPCEEESAEMTDILKADVQRELHRENQDAIARLTEQIKEVNAALNRLVDQNNAQTQALRIVLDGQSTDLLNAAVRHRREHERFVSLDKVVSEATSDLGRVARRLVYAGAIGLLIFGLSFTGAIEALKTLIGKS